MWLIVQTIGRWLMLSVLPASLNYMVPKLLAMFGIGFVSYEGMNVLLSHMNQLLQQQAASLPATTAAILGMAGFGQAFSMIVSALLMRASLSGMDAAGRMVKLKFNGFGS